jgi:D-amino-acid oxidase
MLVVPLTPPKISSAHIQNKIVCVRPVRRGGLRIAAEKTDNQLIIHNYGHGGGGWTRLFGSVQEVILLLNQQLELHPVFKNRPITVVGAGCMGLLSAITLAERGCAVRIIARELESLTSDRAIGFWAPSHRADFAPLLLEQLARIHQASWHAYMNIARGHHHFLTSDSVMQLPVYVGPGMDMGFGPFVASQHIAPPTAVRIDFGNDKNYVMDAYNTFVVAVPNLMQQLRKRITQLGINIELADVNRLDEVGSAIVINCTGLGAGKLVADGNIIPEQGHLIQLCNQPPFEQRQYAIQASVQQQGTGKRLYYAPRDEGFLGVSVIPYQAGLDTNLHEFDKIYERAVTFFGL